MSEQNIQRIETGGKRIVLVGTAHISRESVALVERTIDEERPDTVCVELCRDRYEALRQQDSWREMDIVKVIRQKRTSLLLSQLLMSSFQKRLAKKFNIRPGEEMMRALAKAEEIGARMVLADRGIRVTMLRTWRKMGFWTKTKLLTEMLASPFIGEEVTEEEIEKLKQSDVLEIALQAVGEKMPSLKTTLIDERDLYLAHEIGAAPGEKIVAVVGAGHVPGIVRNFGREIDIDALNTVPPPGLWSRFFGWGFSLGIIILFAAGFFYSGSQASLNMIKWWTIITSACAALGAAMLLAHPLTIVASAAAAPITTLHPLIAAGWVAGLTEASLRKPQVKDFLALADDITTLYGFVRNKITRILLLVAVVNLTTSVGTFVAIPVMMRFF
ncbi:MAG TPA: TraB/GumN family protein [Syntrophales bacterium]|nr:TraB/GumN family protein [Syntrophales bacterium]